MDTITIHGEARNTCFSDRIVWPAEGWLGLGWLAGVAGSVGFPGAV